MSDDLVYSSCSGDLRKKTAVKSRKQTTLPPGIKDDGVVRMVTERNGRGGKTVCCIYGVPLVDSALEALAKRIKSQCGVGGSVAIGVIMIQGDNAAKIKTLLEREGFKIKLAGG